MGPNADIRTINRFNNLIIVGGSQLLVNGVNSCIAIWNGQNWYSSNINFAPISIILGQVSNNGLIYFGGEFNILEASSTAHLLAYDIATDTFTIILTNLNINGSAIRRLVFINDTLYVSGTLKDATTLLTISIMYYTHSTWYNIYLGGIVSYINSYNNLLTVTGEFSSQTGDTGNNIQYLKNGV